MDITSPTGTIDFGRVPLLRGKEIDIDIEISLDVSDVAGNYSIQLSSGGSEFSIVSVNTVGGADSGPIAFPAGPDTLNFPARIRFDAPASAGAVTPATLTITIAGAGITDTDASMAGEAVEVALVMVLDRSGSMSALIGTDTRANRMRASAGVCLDLMLDSEKLGVVAFNHLATTSLALQRLDTGSHRADAESLFQAPPDPVDPALNPSGSTSIGGGVIMAQGMFSGGEDANILVLTDGHHNTAPAIPSLAGNENIYAIGMGTLSAVSDPNLDLLTAGSGNYMLVTGNLTGTQLDKLTKYFLQILFDTSNASIIVDPQATLKPGATHEWPFSISGADEGFDAIVLTEQPELLEFELIGPDKKVIGPAEANQAPGGSFRRGRRVVFYRFLRRTLSGSWKARIRTRKDFFARDRKPGPITYTFLVASRSNLEFRASAHAKGIHVGSDLLISAALTEFGQPVGHRAKVAALVTLPEGGTMKLNLKENQPGRFAATLPTFAPGIYTIHFFAVGKASCGTPFTREATRTAYVMPATYVPSSDPGPIPASEQVPGTDPTQPGGGGRPGGGGGKGSLDELFDRFPDLKKLLERCCGHDHHHHHHGHCHHGHGHGHGHCDCCCHHR